MWHASSAERAQAPVAPVFILGLPRTGSTLLHELLDLHPTLTHRLLRRQMQASFTLSIYFEPESGKGAKG